jgi:predicted DNA-binding transcriptional regulator AlpA
MARKPMTEARAEMAMRQVEMARRFPDTLLTMDAIVLLTGDSAPTIYRHAKAGAFPRPTRPGKWRGGCVIAHLAKVAVPS